LVYLTREGEVEKIFFLLAQHTVESFPISKNLGDITRLLANIQKKWLESCLEELKSLKDRNIYEIIDLSKGRKVIKNHWIFNIYSLQLSTIRQHTYIAALENLDIYSINVKTAYFYGNLDEEIYMEQPKGFRLSGKEKKV